MKKIPLVIKTWAGDFDYDIQYITSSLPSLMKSWLPDWVEIVIYDDASTSVDLINFLKNFEARHDRVRVIWGKSNLGPNGAQVAVYKIIEKEYPDAPFYINCDDDVIYSKYWLKILLKAKRQMEEKGIEGVFSALNMPYRSAFKIVPLFDDISCLLKYKQPALNWLVPKFIYEKIGGFEDQGIAYDTVFSHWMRIFGFPVICLKPSYVQNIGELGAYSKDNTTTAEDFLDNPNIKHRGLKQQLLDWANKISSILIRRNRISDVFPIRWGAEMVYEGSVTSGDRVAFCLFNDSQQMGWHQKAFAKRVKQVAQADRNMRFRLEKICKNLKGDVTVLNFNWQFLPSLREYKKMSGNPYEKYSATRILKALTSQLSRFHRKGVVHNKIRVENIFIDTIDEDIPLAWFGVEIPEIKTLPLSKNELIAMFSNKIDDRADYTIREKFAVRFLETIPPEVMKGGVPNFQSDIYAVGSALLTYIHGDIESMDQLEKQKGKWHLGRTGNLNPQFKEKNVLPILLRCTSLRPEDRFESAMELERFLCEGGI